MKLKLGQSLVIKANPKVKDKFQGPGLKETTSVDVEKDKDKKQK